jgi:hypothetical protein
MVRNKADIAADPSGAALGIHTLIEVPMTGSDEQASAAPEGPRVDVAALRDARPSGEVEREEPAGAAEAGEEAPKPVPAVIQPPRLFERVAVLEAAQTGREEDVADLRRLMGAVLAASIDQANRLLVLVVDARDQLNLARAELGQPSWEPVLPDALPELPPGRGDLLAPRDERRQSTDEPASGE